VRTAGSNVRYSTNEQAVFMLTTLWNVIGKEEFRMARFPLIAALACAAWTPPAYAGDGGNAIPSKPEVTLAPCLLDEAIGLAIIGAMVCEADAWTSASDLTAVTETESTEIIVITVAMTIGAIVTATIEADPAVT
jgi:hypothetical protein